MIDGEFTDLSLGSGIINGLDTIHVFLVFVFEQVIQQTC